MRINALRLYDEKILRQKAEKIEQIDKKIVALAQQMIEVMKKHKGVGLAGNQIGFRKQIITIDLQPCGYKTEPFALINPEIVDVSGAVVDEEGCLSFPGLYINIERPEKAKVVARNIKGEKIEIYAEGLLTRILCHEIDHLRGVLFIDYASKEQRVAIEEFFKKFNKNQDRTIKIN